MPRFTFALGGTKTVTHTVPAGSIALRFYATFARHGSADCIIAGWLGSNMVIYGWGSLGIHIGENITKVLPPFYTALRLSPRQTSPSANVQPSGTGKSHVVA